MIGTTFGGLIFLLALSIPVGAGLGLLGLILVFLYSPLPLTVLLGELTWTTSNSFILVAVPFYIMLGEIILRSGIAERMYRAIVQWISWLPGGLMHSNIAGCAMFAAISGSSVATAVTIGTVALKESKRHKYNDRLFLGTLAAGGTLGILIPPSINLVVYGVMTNTSIPQLYLAGFLPGFLLASLFILTILIICMCKPHYGGKRIETSWRERIRTLPDLIPPLVIFVTVIGSIYAGIATPTESAALGILGALVIAAWQRRLTWTMLASCLEGTVRTTAMIMAVLFGAYFLNSVITAIGLTGHIYDFVIAHDFSPTQLLVVIITCYLVLGCFMETLSMMIATLPITAPLMSKAGFDPVWFGILIVLLMETGMITPPFGINLFMVQGVRGRGQLHDVFIGASPFAVTLLLMIVLICMFPEIALWLPRLAE
jgi:C4-dicarboxylate transporter, DctM subunit